MSPSNNYYEKYFKRLFDFVCSLIAIILFSWLFLIIGLLVRIKLGSPVLFKQARPGKNEKIFNMYKFRTMTDDRDETGDLLHDEIRLTSFGKWLRSTSLDELPELFNILKGDMSFVGPRPLLVRYLTLYSTEQRKRHMVRPGLTGLAQISGRNQLSWNEKFALDIQYVLNVNFGLDIKILFITFYKVFKRDGITSNDNVTTEPFKGNEVE